MTVTRYISAAFALLLAAAPVAVAQSPETATGQEQSPAHSTHGETLASVSAEEQPALPPAGLLAMRARPQLPARVFVDVNAGFQSTNLSFNDTQTTARFEESATWTADYAVEGGPAFALSGGVRLWGPLVARVGFSRFTDSNVAAIAGTVPHPFFFNRDRSISGDSTTLKHEEQAIHVSALWLVPASDRLEISLFGGPTFFTIRRDLVRDVRYTESYPYDTAALESTLVDRVSDGRVGFHAGAEVAFFFTRNVGVGALVSFSRATLDLTSPASGRALSLEAGGLQAGAGIRLRFGGGGTASPPIDERVPGRTDEGFETNDLESERQLVPDSGSDAAPLKEPASGGRLHARVTSPAEVFLGKQATGEPLTVLEPGTPVLVLDESGDWILIQFEGKRWGQRHGWVLRERTDW